MTESFFDIYQRKRSNLMESAVDKEAILNNFGYFQDISPKSRQKLAEICLTKTYEKKEYIFSEEDKGYAVYFCISGRIQLHKTTPDGKEVVIKVIKPGEMFGEVILFERQHYPVTAIALSRSQTFLMPKHQLLCLFELADFRGDFIAMLMRKQRYLADQIKYLTSNDAEERLFLFLRENYGTMDHFRLTVSKKDVAAAIGTTPETLSRLLLRLKKENLLNWEDKYITIHPSVWARLSARSTQ
jgi:CRP/FNR family transcriptional regulator